MKRRRHALVELSSDDSFEDFAPAKLKSKRVSIVLSKDPVQLRDLKLPKSGKQACKKKQLPSCSKQSSQAKHGRNKLSISNKQHATRLTDDQKLKSKLKSRANTISTESEGHPKNDRLFTVNGAAKSKLELSDLDDSLLAVPTRKGPTVATQTSADKAAQCQDSKDSTIKLPLVQTMLEECSKIILPKHNLTAITSPKHISSVATSPKSTATVSGQSDKVACSPANKDSVLHSPANKDSALCSPANKDSVLCSPANKDSALCSPANKDSVLCSPANKDSVLCSPDNKDSALCNPGDKDSALCSPDNKDSALCSPDNTQSALSRLGTRSSSESLFGYSFCQICQKNITGYSSEKRSSHVNKCCDALERLNNFGSSSNAPTSPKPTSSTRVSCPLCPKTYRDRSTLKRHLKLCCKANEKCFETVCEMCFSTTRRKTQVKSTRQAKREASKKAKENKPVPALLVEKENAVNRAQNKILDLVADQDCEDIPATPALKTSNLTTYRSKRNSIWNLAGNAVSTVSAVLKHDNSLINTQSHYALAAPDQSICIDKSALPSQADITQLTQFLQDLGKDGSIKERLSSLMQSPGKSRPDSVSVSQESEPKNSLSESPMKVPDVKSPDTKFIHIKNSFRKKKIPLLNHSFESRRDVFRSRQESTNDNSVLEIIVDLNNKPAPKDISGVDHKDESETKDQVSRTDRSPNPSEISAVGNSSLVRTPARNTSEIVSSIRDEDHSSGHDEESSLPDDSNIDLFAEDTIPSMREEAVEFDRSLLNVSPITDSGVNEEDEVEKLNDILDKTKEIECSKRDDSPVYRPKQCSSTTHDCDVITAPVPLSSKNVQVHVDRETRSKGVGTEISTRVTGTNTSVPQTRNCGTNTDPVTRASAKAQVDGEQRLCGVMTRLLSLTTTMDVTLVCNDEQQRRAHSVILEVVCPALLASHQGPGDGGRCVDLGLSSDGADRFLEFVYTQRIQKEILHPDILCELYDIAHRVEMPELTAHLHTKQMETIEIEFEKESGGTILLSLSSQDILNLSQQLETVSSQKKTLNLSQQLDTVSSHNKTLNLSQELDTVSSHKTLNLSQELETVSSQNKTLNLSQQLETVSSQNKTLNLSQELEPVSSQNKTRNLSQELETVSSQNKSQAAETSFQQEYLSFQDYDFYPILPLDVRQEESVAQELGNSFDDIIRELNVTPNPITKGSEIPEPLDNNYGSGSDDFDLPSTGLLVNETETSFPVDTAMSEEDRRASQLIQDVEFIDLVKKLDDPIVSSPLSFIDHLSPIKLNPTPPNKDLPLVNVDDIASLSLAESFIDSLHESTPKHVSKRGRPKVSKKGSVSTSPHLNMSKYQKTPCYRTMDTPRLRSETDKFGLKPLSKKRAVAKLEEIHRFTNKKFLKCPEQCEDEPTNGPPDKKKREPKCQSGKARKRKTSTASSSPEKECPVGNISVSGKLPKSTVTEVSGLVTTAIRTNKELHCQVLEYEPIDILEIKGLLKRKTGVGLIAQVLDDQGITYFNSESKAKGFGRKGGVQSNKSRK